MVGDGAALAASLHHLEEMLPPQVDLENSFGSVMASIEALFDLDGAGLMVVDDQQVLRSVMATDTRGAALEAAEQAAGIGPCIDGYIECRPVACADIRADQRYQAVAAQLGANPIVAVLGVPVRMADTPVGVLDLYVDRPHQWEAGEIAALQSYADVLGRLLAWGLSAHRNDRLASHLQTALDNRVLVDRAIGYLMASEHLDARGAFERLRRAARGTRTKVSVLAAALLQTGSLDSGAG